MTRKDLHALPPLARARAMDRPYQPGRRRRHVLIGAVVIAALLAAFLARMPDGAPKRTSGRATSDATPGVVYPKLRPSTPPPSPREPGGTSAANPTP